MLLGCGSAGESGGISVQEGSSFEELIWRTSVRFNEDGTQTIFSEAVTQEQVKLEQAREEARKKGAEATGAEAVGTTEEAITTASCSNPDNLRLYDATGYGGNQLCFTGSGDADLSAYCRTRDIWFNCTDSWDGRVRSYKTGESYGKFYTSDTYSCAVDCTPILQVDEDVTPASECIQVATHLRLIDQCEPAL